MKTVKYIDIMEARKARGEALTYLQDAQSEHNLLILEAKKVQQEIDDINSEFQPKLQEKLEESKSLLEQIEIKEQTINHYRDTWIDCCKEVEELEMEQE